MNTLTPHKCAQCGSKLVLVSTVTEKIPGNLFPQTTSTFRCTDDECQSRRDKEMEKRLELKKEKEVADQRRINERLQKRQSDLLLKTSFKTLE